MNQIYLIGPPCSGKTAVGKELAAYGMDYLSTGDIARKFAKTNKATAEALAAGQMAPYQLVEPEFRRHIFVDLPFSTTRVVDGFPRYAEQLLDVVAWSATRSDRKPFFVVLDTAKEVCDGRALLRLRDDDDKQTYEARWRNWSALTKPMVNWLRVRYPDGVYVFETLDNRVASDWIAAVINNWFEWQGRKEITWKLP